MTVPLHGWRLTPAARDTLRLDMARVEALAGVPLEAAWHLRADHATGELAEPRLVRIGGPHRVITPPPLPGECVVHVHHTPGRLTPSDPDVEASGLIAGFAITDSTAEHLLVLSSPRPAPRPARARAWTLGGFTLIYTRSAE